MIIQVKIGSKGEIVIPKKIRETMGLERNKKVILELKDKEITLKSAGEDIAKLWEEIATKEKVNTSKWIYGDKLYEEVF